MRSYLAVFLIVAALGTACDGSNTHTLECPREAACFPEVLEEMQGRAESGSSVRPYNSLVEVLGNVEYSIEGGPAEPLSEAVVVGKFVDVVAGRAFSDERPGSPDGVELDFDSPDAIWRSVHAMVEVEEVVSGSLEGPVIAGFAFDPKVPLHEIREEFVEMGSVLLFLNRTPVFDYDPEVFGTVSDGALLGVVDRGRISLPVMDGDQAEELLRDASTLNELKSAAEGPRRVIQLDPSGVRVLSSDYKFEPYPGSTWYGPDGEPVSEDTNIINAITAPDHCGWESAVMMHVGWPPGHDASDASESHQYIRDPKGVIAERFARRLDLDAPLPESAENTGFRTDFMGLWLDPADGYNAYLVFADHTERWPRAREIVACA